MALNSNAMNDTNGNPLKHFTPFPTVLSDGVNVFSQDLNLEKNPYVFPPFCLIFAVLKFCAQIGVKSCTFVVPELFPRPVWWPFFWEHVSVWNVLDERNEHKALLYPSTKGFKLDTNGLPWRLIVARLHF